MYKLLTFLILLTMSIKSWSQTYECFDTTGLILEKEFYKKDKLDIRIVYIYKDRYLIKRIWYNSKGEIVSIVLDYEDSDEKDE
jgi:hypothetical protein